MILIFLPFWLRLEKRRLARFRVKVGLGTQKEYSLIGKIGSFKLQILSSSLSALDLPEFSALRIRLTRFLNLIGKVCF